MSLLLTGPLLKLPSLGGGGSTTFAFTDSFADSKLSDNGNAHGESTEVTSTTVAIGTAASDRLVCMMFFMRSYFGSGLPTVAIDSNTVTPISSVVSDGTIKMAYYERLVTTGTTTTVGYSGTDTYGWGCGIWIRSNTKSAGTPVTLGAATDPFPLNINVSSGDDLIGAAGFRDQGTSNWGTLTGLTLDADEQIASSFSQGLWFGSASGVAAATPRTVNRDMVAGDDAIGIIIPFS